MGKRERRLRPLWLWTLWGIPALVLCLGLFVLAVNIFIIHEADPFLVSGLDKAPSAPVAIVLGAAFYSDTAPSPMMADRMDAAIHLYREGKVGQLLLSGDSRTPGNQVSQMLGYVTAHGVPHKDILTDGAGYTTYHTMLRAKTVFHIDSALVCTQDFHLARSIYLARSLGIDANGVPAEIRGYSSLKETMREWGARVKAFVQISF